MQLIATGSYRSWTRTRRCGGFPADDKKPAYAEKPTIIQIDASKLPPAVLNQLFQLAEAPKKGEKGSFEKGDDEDEKPSSKKNENKKESSRAR